MSLLCLVYQLYTHRQSYKKIADLTSQLAQYRRDSTDSHVRRPERPSLRNLQPHPLAAVRDALLSHEPGESLARRRNRRPRVLRRLSAHRARQVPRAGLYGSANDVVEHCEGYVEERRDTRIVLWGRDNQREGRRGVWVLVSAGHTT